MVSLLLSSGLQYSLYSAEPPHYFAGLEAVFSGEPSFFAISV